MELILMTCFIVKHFVCDFPAQIQTPWMFLNKGTYGHPGGIAHALVHVAASAFILTSFSIATMHEWGVFPFTVETAFIGTLLVFEFLIHYHMDWWKMWWNRRKGYKPDTHPQFWTWLGIDQMVHYLTYVVMVWAWA